MENITHARQMYVQRGLVLHFQKLQINRYKRLLDSCYQYVQMISMYLMTK